MGLKQIGTQANWNKKENLREFGTEQIGTKMSQKGQTNVILKNITGLSLNILMKREVEVKNESILK